jgi:hypothetical protein
MSERGRDLASVHILPYQPFGLHMKVVGHLHKIAGNQAFASFVWQQMPMLYQHFFCIHRQRSFLVVSTPKNNSLCAIAEIARIIKDV